MISKLLIPFCSLAEKSNVKFASVKNAFFALLLLTGFGMRAQVSSYVPTGTGVGQTYTPIAGTGLFGLFWDDNVSPAIPLGFNFNFNGRIYSNCYVSSNGFITFGSAPTTTNFAPISGTEGYDGAIAVFGRDLINTNIDITYLTQGLPGSRTFTVQYTARRKPGTGTSSGVMNMQIILYETSNVVDLLYNPNSASGTWIAQLTGQVGLRGELNTDFNNKNFTGTNWPTAPPVFLRGSFNSHSVNTKFNAVTITAQTRLTFTPPTCLAPYAVNATLTSISATNATINWTAPTPAPASGYQYMVSTVAPNDMNSTGTPVAGTTSPFMGTVGAGVTTASVTGLTGSTVYYIYVRSNCPGYGGWSAAGSFTTLCGGIGVLPYTQDFSTAVVPAIPPCNYLDTTAPVSATQGFWFTSVPSAPDWGFNTQHIRINARGPATNDNASTYYIAGLTLTGGVSYRLSYDFGASSEFTYTTQNMSVILSKTPYYNAADPVLADHYAFKFGPYSNIVNFTPATTGVYYIGFYDYTVESNATTLLDNIVVKPTTCFAPTLLAVSGTTSGSTNINWTPPATPPAGGYQYYYSTTTSASNQPPSGAVPSGSVGAGVTTTGLGGLTQNTVYYYWVRSNCGSEYSAWSLQGNFTTLPGPPPPTCVPSGAGFPQDPNGITNVTFADINNTSGIEPNNYADFTYLGPGHVAQGQLLPIAITYRTGYTYDTKIWVDYNNDGTFSDPAELVYTGMSGSSVPNVLNASFTPAGVVGTTYRMRIGGIDSPIFSGGALTPCRTGAYQAYEDYLIYITPPPPTITFLDINGDGDSNPNTAKECGGISYIVKLNAGSPASNYDSYVWSPSATVTGTAATGWTLSPTTTTTYILTATNSVTFANRKVTFTFTVKPTPSAVTVTPALATVCQTVGPATALTASGGIISGVPVYTENFNGPTAPGWTTTNSTTGSAIVGGDALAEWGLFPDGYAPSFAQVHSNDNSQFYLANSDAPGSGYPNPSNPNTLTTLTSPPISLTGYTTATLSFWHFYRYYNGGESGTVQISTTAVGGPYTDLVPAFGTGNVGTENAWVQQTYNLDAYATAGNTIYVRFKYVATWDWYWAIDNFSIVGSSPSSITWAATTGPAYAGLFTNAAATIPYTGTAATTVYALPSANVSYVATAAGSICNRASAPVPITVTPLSAGTIVTANQTACGPAAPIVTSGVLGTVVRWEYADAPAFSPWIPIAGTAGLTTLTSALIGNVTTTRQYRIVVNTGGCVGTVVSNPVHQISVSTSTWNGASWAPAAPTAGSKVIFTGNYTGAANLSVCSVQVNSPATVTFNSGFTLTSQGAVTVAVGGNLIFNDTASLVQVDPTAVNAGDIIFRRNTTPMRKFDYTCWSSPVDGQIIAKLSPLTQPDKYYYFNTGTYQWTSIAAPGLQTMTPGRGYIIRGPNSFSQTVPAVFSTYFGFDGVTHGGGIPNNGTIVTPVGHNSAINNLDCIGNPYPSALSANLFMTDAANSAALGAGGTTMYFWTHNTPITGYVYASNDYASYNYSGGVGTGTMAGSNPCALCNNAVPNGNIAAGQGFMIKTAAAGNVTFKNTMRLTGLNNQFFRMNNQVDQIETLERNRIWLEMSNTEGAYKQALIGYIENATDGLDAGFDGTLVEAGNPIALYSILGSEKLTIQGKALPFNIADQIPVGYRTTVAGTFQINLGDFDGIFADTNVYLEDKLLNIIQNLKENPYSFTTETGTFDDRFVVRYDTESTLGTNAAVFNENEVVVYKNNHSVYIETSLVDMKSVALYDLRGRKIAEQKTVNGKKAVFENLEIAQQVLLVQITSKDNVTVTKKMVF